MRQSRFSFAIRHMLNESDKSDSVFFIASDCFRKIRQIEANFLSMQDIATKELKFSLHGTGQKLKLINIIDEKLEEKTKSKGQFVITKEKLDEDFIQNHTNTVNLQYKILLFSNPLVNTLRCFVFQDSDKKFKEITGFDEININMVLGSQVHYQTYGSKPYKPNWLRSLFSWFTAEGKWPDTDKDIDVALPLLKPDAQLRRIKRIGVGSIVICICSIAANGWFLVEKAPKDPFHQIAMKKSLFFGKEFISNPYQIECLIVKKMLNIDMDKSDCDLNLLKSIDEYNKKNKAGYQSIAVMFANKQKEIIKDWQQKNQSDWLAIESSGLKLDTIESKENTENSSPLLKILLNQFAEEKISLLLEFDHWLKGDNNDNEYYRIPSWENLLEIKILPTKDNKKISTKKEYLCHIVRYALNFDKNSSCNTEIENIDSHISQEGININNTTSTLEKYATVVKHWDSKTAEHRTFWMESPSTMALNGMDIQLQDIPKIEKLRCRMVNKIIGKELGNSCDPTKTTDEITKYLTSKEDKFLNFIKKTKKTNELWNDIFDIERLKTRNITLSISNQKLDQQHQLDCLVAQWIVSKQQTISTQCQLGVYFSGQSPQADDLKKPWQDAVKPIVDDWKNQRLNARTNPEIEDLHSLGLNESPQ